MKLNMSNNNLLAEGATALGGALKDNKVMTELNIAGNDLGYNANDDADMSGAIAISDAIPTMGALTSLDISANNIGELATVEGWKSKDGDGRAPWIGPDGQTQWKDPPKEPAGAIALAGAIISANGALASLDLSQNSIPELEATQIKTSCQSVSYTHLTLPTKA